LDIGLDVGYHSPGCDLSTGWLLAILLHLNAQPAARILVHPSFASESLWWEEAGTSTTLVTRGRWLGSEGGAMQWLGISVFRVGMSGRLNAGRRESEVDARGRSGAGSSSVPMW